MPSRSRSTSGTPNSTVSTGDEQDAVAIFEGIVTAVESSFPEAGTPTICVYAEDALFRARLARRTRVFEDVTLEDLAREVARAAGLKPRMEGYFTEQIDVRAQINESDLAFLRRVALRYDAELQVIDGALYLRPSTDFRRDAALELTMTRELRSARALADLAHQVTEVTASGFDAKQGQRFAVSSRVDDLGPGTGRPGVDVLKKGLGERAEHLGHLQTQDEAEARALVNSAYRHRARRFVQVSAVAEGNPEIRVGRHVKLLGLGRRFDNTYVVCRAVHRFDTTSGYLTDFDAECAYLGEG